MRNLLRAAIVLSAFPAAAAEPPWTPLREPVSIGAQEGSSARCRVVEEHVQPGETRLANATLISRTERRAGTLVTQVNTHYTDGSRMAAVVTLDDKGAPVTADIENAMKGQGALQRQAGKEFGETLVMAFAAGRPLSQGDLAYSKNPAHLIGLMALKLAPVPEDGKIPDASLAKPLTNEIRLAGEAVRDGSTYAVFDGLAEAGIGEATIQFRDTILVDPVTGFWLEEQLEVSIKMGDQVLTQTRMVMQCEIERAGKI